MRSFILIPHVQIHNANALSSPYTVGFPAMTAWLGGMHALERKLRGVHEKYQNLVLKSIAVVSHDFHLHRRKGRGEYTYSLIGTGNPLDKSGNRSPFIEEARCRLTVSLLIEYEWSSPLKEVRFLRDLTRILHARMKWAGGDIIDFKNIDAVSVKDASDQYSLLRKLMPGYVLTERSDLMENTMCKGKDALEALLEHLVVQNRCEATDSGEFKWTQHRKEPGWIVPIAVGFQGISPLAKAEQQRDPETPHRFAESVVTLGEFIMPYRVEELDHILWHYQADLEKSLYLCKQNQKKAQA